MESLLIDSANEIASYVAKTTNFLMKRKALALIEAISFYGGVRHERFSGEQETASEKSTIS